MSASNHPTEPTEELATVFQFERRGAAAFPDGRVVERREVVKVCGQRNGAGALWFWVTKVVTENGGLLAFQYGHRTKEDYAEYHQELMGDRTYNMTAGVEFCGSDGAILMDAIEARCN